MAQFNVSSGNYLPIGHSVVNSNARLNNSDLINTHSLPSDEAMISASSKKELPSFLVPKSQLDFIKDPLKKALQDPDEMEHLLVGVSRQAIYDPSLKRALKNRAQDFAILGLKLPFWEEENSVRFKRIVETGGVSIGKMCQILADDPTVPEKLRKDMAIMKSQGLKTRNKNQAKEFIDQLLWANGTGANYQINKSLSAGTVGETWLASNSSGDTKVIKMLKQGVTKPRLEEERLIWKAVINSAHENNPKLRNQALAMVDQMFEGWLEELDFRLEKEGAEHLAERAKRYQVAPIEDIGLDKANGTGVSIICGVAPGVQLDKLHEMLQVYKESPVEYASKYADIIAKNPWLAYPDDWKEQLAPGYLASQNEQVLFLRSKAGRTSHGDPHMGNVFVDFQDGKLQWTYIDTGLTVTRTPGTVMKHLGLSLDFLLGNSKNMAKELIRKADALPINYEGKPITPKQLRKILNRLLQERLFDSGIDLKNMKTVQTVIEHTLEDVGIVQSAQDSVFLKSQLQTMLTYRELAKVTDTTEGGVFAKMAPDVFKGLKIGMKQAPLQTIHVVGRTLFETIKHPSQSHETLNSIRKRNK